MRIFFFLTLLCLATFHSLKSQSRYSFGTDYILLLNYPQKYLQLAQPVIQLGLSATKEIGIKSNLVLGTYYYQIRSDVGDSIFFRRKYIEIPVSLKFHYTMFDKVFKGHMTTGAGINVLLWEESIWSDSVSVPSSYKEKSFSPDAINFFWGIGFDIRINKAFYLSFDGLLKTFYFFSTMTNETGRKISISPLTKAGIFVWINQRQ